MHGCYSTLFSISKSFIWSVWGLTNIVQFYFGKTNPLQHSSNSWTNSWGLSYSEITVQPAWDQKSALWASILNLHFTFLKYCSTSTSLSFLLCGSGSFQYDSMLQSTSSDSETPVLAYPIHPSAHFLVSIVQLADKLAHLLFGGQYLDGST